MDSLIKAISIVSPGNQAGFAKRITEHIQRTVDPNFEPVTPQQVWNWINRDHAVPVQCCNAIEELCIGEVTRKDLRPDDWHLIWRDLDDDPGRRRQAAQITQ